MMKRAVVIGPYRHHNFGDDLIGAIIAKDLQSKNYEVSIPLLCKENTEWLDIKYAESDNGIVRKSDLVIIGGGGIFGDSGVQPNDYYRKIAFKAALEANEAGKRIIVTGIGAGPLALKESKKIVNQIASISERIGVRDTESKSFLEEIDVDCNKLVEGADLALLSSKYLSFISQTSDRMGFQFDVIKYADIIDNNPTLSMC